MVDHRYRAVEVVFRGRSAFSGVGVDNIKSFPKVYETGAAGFTVPVFFGISTGAAEVRRSDSHGIFNEPCGNFDDMGCFVNQATGTRKDFASFLTFAFDTDVPENIQCCQMDFKKFIIGEHVQTESRIF